MLLRYWRLVAITLVALSVGASFAHVLELPAKLTLTGEQYVLVQTIYRYFGPVASVLEPVSIAALIGLVFLTRRRSARHLTVVALLGVVAALLTWFVTVSPMNTEIAAWAGDAPAGWTAVRDRWEAGQVAVFALKLGALVTLIGSLLVEIPVRDRTAEAIAA